MRWTDEQKAVIDHRGADLLVSASAGSGKTAVLVSHVIELITDSESEVDLDRLLIVTFTKAAAGEMRERITRALDEKIRAGTNITRLIRQRAQIAHADISTLDSFFIKLIRSNYQKLGIDPDFRQGDDSELKLLKEDVIERLFEEKYASQDQEFYKLVDSYGENNNDDKLKEMVVKLYDYAQSMPDPDLWLRESVEGAALGADDPCVIDYMIKTKEKLRKMIQLCDACASEMSAAGHNLAETFLSDAQTMRELVQTSESDRFIDMLRSMSLCKKSRVSKKDAGEEVLRADKLVRLIRDALGSMGKNGLKDVYADYTGVAREVSRRLSQISELAAEFGKKYYEEKLDRNILDFSDESHLVLKLLRENDIVRDELQGRYYEIMVDEYQDTNPLQDEIISLLRSDASGRGNVFTVGDVKQSIYSFRQADPDIFSDRYELFERTSCGDKIDLHKNFRSRPQVLDSVNSVFNEIMSADLGRVDYKNKGYLVYGANYSESESDAPYRYRTELLITEKSEDDDENNEIAVTAKKIKELVDPDTGLTIYDNNTGMYRKAGYGDIVILLRATKKSAEEYVKTLLEHGIPAATSKKVGFFGAPEIQLMCNLLKIIDNPRQDVALMGVLTSPLFNINENKLLKARLDQRDNAEAGTMDSYLYDAIEASDDPELTSFNKKLLEYRRFAAYNPINELLLKIFEDTGYDYYVRALPNGDVRKGNLELLLERAIDFEKLSYSGIFQFNRYLEQLKKHEVDYGEADVLSGSSNAVSVISIHMSKGLEYPIVFIGNTAKEFNRSDMYEKLLRHGKYGIRADLIDSEKNCKFRSLSKFALSKLMRERTVEEEMRLLYVAMTRARDKLIITGTLKDLKKLDDYEIDLQDGDALPSWYAGTAGSFLDMLLFALNRSDSSIDLSLYPASEMEVVAFAEYDREAVRKDAFLRIKPGSVFDERLSSHMSEIFSYIYPHRGASANKMVYSVSELKKKNSSQTVTLSADEVFESAEMKAAAERGSAYHLIMARIDVSHGEDKACINSLREELTGAGFIKPDIAEMINPDRIAAYFKSSVGQRSVQADRRGQLFRERKFILQKPAREIDPSNSEEDNVMIKGIIDNYFIEDGKIILLDYKTDRIVPGEKQILAKRYEEQLNLYAEALFRAYGLPVAEKYIYSFVLGCFIEV